MDLDAIEQRVTAYRASHDHLGAFACCAAHASANDVPALVARVRELEGLIGDLADPEPCHYDHHGYCQAHWWFHIDLKCPHARARELTGEGA